ISMSILHRNDFLGYFPVAPSPRGRATRLSLLPRGAPSGRTPAHPLIDSGCRSATQSQIEISECAMQENFRQFLDRLRQTGELVDLHQPVDIRHIATLVDQAKTALFFHKVIGYDVPVVSGIIRSRERAMMGLGAETYREIEDKLANAIAKPIP